MAQQISIESFTWAKPGASNTDTPQPAPSILDVTKIHIPVTGYLYQDIE